MSSSDFRADDTRPHDGVPAARLILLADGLDARDETLDSSARERWFRGFPHASRRDVDRLLVASRTLRAISEIQRQRASRAREVSELLLRRKRHSRETAPKHA